MQTVEIAVPARLYRDLNVVAAQLGELDASAAIEGALVDALEDMRVERRRREDYARRVRERLDTRLTT